MQINGSFLACFGEKPKSHLLVNLNQNFTWNLLQICSS